MNEADHKNKPVENKEPEPHKDEICPVCGERLHHEKCKVVCRNQKCIYRIIFNCAEF